MQAAIASLLEIELSEVQNYKELGCEWFEEMCKTMRSHGYQFDSTLNAAHDLTKLKNEIGIKGYFYATVRSIMHPDVFHAVVIDSDCNIVHPVNQAYEGITKFKQDSEQEINGIRNVFLFNPIKEDS